MNMNRGRYCRYTAPCLLSLLNWFYNSFYTTVIENNIIANELFKLNIIPYKPNYSVTIAYSLQNSVSNGAPTMLLVTLTTSPTLKSAKS